MCCWLIRDLHSYHEVNYFSLYKYGSEIFPSFLWCTDRKFKEGKADMSLHFTTAVLCLENTGTSINLAQLQINLSLMKWADGQQKAYQHGAANQSSHHQSLNSSARCRGGYGWTNGPQSSDKWPQTSRGFSAHQD